MSLTPVEIIAHRGASRERLENTLAAFDLALVQGADGIELDVHGTRDGAVVVLHDATVQMGNPKVATPIADLELAIVRGCQLSDGLAMPTLDEVLDLVGRRGTVYVEVKAVGIEDALVACLERHPASRLAVHAFDHRIPVAVRARRPGTAIGVLSASYPLDVPGMLRPAVPVALWQQAQLIDAELVRQAHAAGSTVIAWTENDPDHARQLLAFGVDALCTDTPALLRSALFG